MKQANLHTPEKSAPSIEVLERAVAVLEYMATHEQALSLQKIAADTGLAKSSVYRLLLTWERLGYVERVGPNGHLRLGVRVLALGRNVACRNRMVELTQTVMQQLHERFRESVYLGVYRHGKVILVDAIQSTQTVRVVVDLGETCLLHASAQGRCVAAFLDPECLASLLQESGFPKLTTKTNTDPGRYSRILSDIRTNGYTVNWEETVEGCVCVGAPFFAGSDGPVLGSIGISIPIHRVNEQLMAEIVDQMKAVSEEISGRLVELVAEPGCLSLRQARQQSGVDLFPTSRKRSKRTEITQQGTTAEGRPSRPQIRLPGEGPAVSGQRGTTKRAHFIQRTGQHEKSILGIHSISRAAAKRKRAICRHFGVLRHRSR